MSERYELPPARLARWLERWADANAPVAWTDVRKRDVAFTGARGASLLCEPPFPPIAPALRGRRDGFDPDPLLEHVERERTVAVLLVRLGGHAAGIFVGDRLVESKVGSRPVHGRHRKGGSSSGRFARRRAGQERVAAQAAADVAARVLLPWAERVDAVVLGGDRRALAAVLEDPRLAPLRARADDRVLDIPDPRQAVLRAAPERFLATIVRPFGRIEA